MYTRHESSRRKFQKVKCPYCNETSQVESRLNTIQFRICKNNHHFVYDSELEYLIQRTTNYKRFEEDLKHKDMKKEELWLTVIFTLKQEDKPIRMVFKNGQSRARRT